MSPAPLIHAERALPDPSDWTFELLERYHEVIRAAAASFGLDTYPNQLEIISAEQMMDAYMTCGAPCPSAPRRPTAPPHRRAFRPSRRKTCSISLKKTPPCWSPGNAKLCAWCARSRSTSTSALTFLSGLLVISFLMTLFMQIQNQPESTQAATA
jgi:SpoVR like protein